MNKLLWIALSIGLSTQLLSATSSLPLTSGKAIDGTVKEKEKKYYNITVPKNKSVRVNLTELEADIDLYIKKGNEVRVRFNDCYSSNSNTENEECIVSNEGESSIYTIMVNGFKQSAFTLKATVDGSEEIPTLSSDPLADAIEKKEGKQYRVEGKKAETITVTLSDLTANADLRVRVGRKAGLHSFNCKSNNSGTKTEECVITPKKDATVYVHVYGYQASNYSLKAVKGNVSTPCITLKDLKAKIKNNEDVTKVNTSCITNMSKLFYFNRNFNQDISSWDVSNVRDMSYMFSDAKTFNQDISSWNTSNVRDMNYMFSGAKTFKGHNLSSWNVGKVSANRSFFTNTGSGNIAPKWNIDKAIVNIAKELCLNQDNSTNDVLCSPNEHLAYVVKKEGSYQDKNNVIHIISTQNWKHLGQSTVSDGGYCTVLSLNKLENTRLFYTISTDGNGGLYNFYYLDGSYLKSAINTIMDRNPDVVIKTISNGKKLSFESTDFDYPNRDNNGSYLYDISDISNIKKINNQL